MKLKLTETKTVSVEEIIKQNNARPGGQMNVRRTIDMPVSGLLMGGDKENGEATTEKELDLAVHERYYLPVLNINIVDEWPSKPLEERKHFTDKVAYETCLGNCCGVKGLKGACCHLDPDDLEHVLGPIKDKEWIRDIIAWFKHRGINYTRQDILIDYDEGRIIGETLFKNSRNNAIFKDEKAYPFLRFQVVGPRYACRFMNPETHLCGIYSQRPDMCRNYSCQYIQTNFLIKTAAHPNRWQKMR